MAMKFYGTQVKAKAHGMMDSRIEAACIYLKNKARESLSRSQPTAGTGAFKRGLDPSQPGEYPKIVTGSFRRNVNHEYDRKTHTGRVGTNDKRGMWFELGTVKMTRRPWLSLLLKQYGQEAKNIIETGRTMSDTGNIISGTSSSTATGAGGARGRTGSGTSAYGSSRPVRGGRVTPGIRGASQKQHSGSTHKGVKDDDTLPTFKTGSP